MSNDIEKIYMTSSILESKQKRYRELECLTKLLICDVIENYKSKKLDKSKISILVGQFMANVYEKIV